MRNLKEEVQYHHHNLLPTAGRFKGREKKAQHVLVQVMQFAKENKDSRMIVSMRFVLTKRSSEDGQEAIGGARA